MTGERALAGHEATFADVAGTTALHSEMNSRNGPRGDKPSVPCDRRMRPGPKLLAFATACGSRHFSISLLTLHPHYTSIALPRSGSHLRIFHLTYTEIQ